MQARRLKCVKAGHTKSNSAQVGWRSPERVEMVQQWYLQANRRLTCTNRAERRASAGVGSFEIGRGARDAGTRGRRIGCLSLRVAVWSNRLWTSKR